MTLYQTQPMRAVPPIQRTYTHSVSLGESKSSVESCLARERKEKTKLRDKLAIYNFVGTESSETEKR